MKKTIYTLNVDNYAPDICALTYPFIAKYADKIGADFHVISERKFPDMPVTYEKLQVKELAEKAGNDWNIYIDSDALVHPDTIDFTSLIHKDTVMHNGADMANIRWRYDNVFLRDGRNIGSCNWLAIASDWCLDLWSPLDISLQQALDNIYPTSNEVQTGITKEHLIDDYTLSRNIARYGLKFTTAQDLMKVKGIEQANFFWHQYTVPSDEKVVEIRKLIKAWGL
jgi:hypothetical protein